MWWSSISSQILILLIYNSLDRCCDNLHHWNCTACLHGQLENSGLGSHCCRLGSLFGHLQGEFSSHLFTLSSSSYNVYANWVMLTKEIITLYETHTFRSSISECSASGPLHKCRSSSHSLASSMPSSCGPLHYCSTSSTSSWLFVSCVPVCLPAGCRNLLPHRHSLAALLNNIIQLFLSTTFGVGARPTHDHTRNAKCY